VELLKVELVCPNRPKGNIFLEFKDHDPKKVRKFTIKEGCVYCMKVHFIVRNDIVFGLKFVNNVYKLMAKGTLNVIQSIRTKTRWVVLHLRRPLINLTCPGPRLPRAFWQEVITKEKAWYIHIYIVFGQRRNRPLSIRLCDDNR